MIKRIPLLEVKSRCVLLTNRCLELTTFHVLSRQTEYPIYGFNVTNPICIGAKRAGHETKEIGVFREARVGC